MSKSDRDNMNAELEQMDNRQRRDAISKKFQDLKFEAIPEESRYFKDWVDSSRIQKYIDRYSDADIRLKADPLAEIKSQCEALDQDNEVLADAIKALNQYPYTLQDKYKDCKIKLVTLESGKSDIEIINNDGKKLDVPQDDKNAIINDQKTQLDIITKELSNYKGDSLSNAKHNAENAINGYKDALDGNGTTLDQIRTQEKIFSERCNEIKQLSENYVIGNDAILNINPKEKNWDAKLFAHTEKDYNATNTLILKEAKQAIKNMDNMKAILEDKKQMATHEEAFKKQQKTVYKAGKANYNEYKKNYDELCKLYISDPNPQNYGPIDSKLKNLINFKERDYQQKPTLKKAQELDALYKSGEALLEKSEEVQKQYNEKNNRTNQSELSKALRLIITQERRYDIDLKLKKQGIDTGRLSDKERAKTISNMDKMYAEFDRIPEPSTVFKDFTITVVDSYIEGNKKAEKEFKSAPLKVMSELNNTMQTVFKDEVFDEKFTALKQFPEALATKCKDCQIQIVTKEDGKTDIKVVSEVGEEKREIELTPEEMDLLKKDQATKVLALSEHAEKMPEAKTKCRDMRSALESYQSAINGNGTTLDQIEVANNTLKENVKRINTEGNKYQIGDNQSEAMGFGLRWDRGGIAKLEAYKDVNTTQSGALAIVTKVLIPKTEEFAKNLEDQASMQRYEKAFTKQQNKIREANKQKYEEYKQIYDNLERDFLASNQDTNAKLDSKLTKLIKFKEDEYSKAKKEKTAMELHELYNKADKLIEKNKQLGLEKTRASEELVNLVSGKKELIEKDIDGFNAGKTKAKRMGVFKPNSRMDVSETKNQGTANASPKIDGKNFQLQKINNYLGEIKNWGSINFDGKYTEIPQFVTRYKEVKTMLANNKKENTLDKDTKKACKKYTKKSEKIIQTAQNKQKNGANRALLAELNKQSVVSIDTVEKSSPKATKWENREQSQASKKGDFLTRKVQAEEVVAKEGRTSRRSSTVEPKARKHAQSEAGAKTRATSIDGNGKGARTEPNLPRQRLYTPPTDAPPMPPKEKEVTKHDTARRVAPKPLPKTPKPQEDKMKIETPQQLETAYRLNIMQDEAVYTKAGGAIKLKEDIDIYIKIQADSIGGSEGQKEYIQNYGPYNNAAKVRDYLKGEGNSSVITIVKDGKEEKVYAVNYFNQRLDGLGLGLTTITPPDPYKDPQKLKEAIDAYVAMEASMNAPLVAEHTRDDMVETAKNIGLQEKYEDSKEVATYLAGEGKDSIINIDGKEVLASEYLKQRLEEAKLGTALKEPIVEPEQVEEVGQEVEPGPEQAQEVEPEPEQAQEVEPEQVQEVEVEPEVVQEGVERQEQRPAPGVQPVQGSIEKWNPHAVTMYEKSNKDWKKYMRDDVEKYFELRQKHAELVARGDSEDLQEVERQLKMLDNNIKYFAKLDPKTEAGEHAKNLFLTLSTDRNMETPIRYNDNISANAVIELNKISNKAPENMTSNDIAIEYLDTIKKADELARNPRKNNDDVAKLKHYVDRLKTFDKYAEGLKTGDDEDKQRAAQITDRMKKFVDYKDADTLVKASTKAGLDNDLKTDIASSLVVRRMERKAYDAGQTIMNTPKTVHDSFNRFTYASDAKAFVEKEVKEDRPTLVTSQTIHFLHGEGLKKQIEFYTEIENGSRTATVAEREISQDEARYIRTTLQAKEALDKDMSAIKDWKGEAKGLGKSEFAQSVSALAQGVKDSPVGQAAQWVGDKISRKKPEAPEIETEEPQPRASTVNPDGNRMDNDNDPDTLAEPVELHLPDPNETDEEFLEKMQAKINPDGIAKVHNETIEIDLGDEDAMMDEPKNAPKPREERKDAPKVAQGQNAPAAQEKSGPARYVETYVKVSGLYKAALAEEKELASAQAGVYKQLLGQIEKKENAETARYAAAVSKAKEDHKTDKKSARRALQALETEHDDNKKVLKAERNMVETAAERNLLLERQAVEARRKMYEVELKKMRKTMDKIEQRTEQGKRAAQAGKSDRITRAYTELGEEVFRQGVDLKAMKKEEKELKKAIAEVDHESRKNAVRAVTTETLREKAESNFSYLGFTRKNAMGSVGRWAIRSYMDTGGNNKGKLINSIGSGLPYIQLAPQAIATLAYHVCNFGFTALEMTTSLIGRATQAFGDVSMSAYHKLNTMLKEERKGYETKFTNAQGFDKVKYALAIAGCKFGTFATTPLAAFGIGLKVSGQLLEDAGRTMKNLGMVIPSAFLVLTNPLKVDLWKNFGERIGHAALGLTLTATNMFRKFGTGIRDMASSIDIGPLRGALQYIGAGLQSVSSLASSIPVMAAGLFKDGTKGLADAAGRTILGAINNMRPSNVLDTSKAEMSGYQGFNKDLNNKHTKVDDDYTKSLMSSEKRQTEAEKRHWNKPEETKQTNTRPVTTEIPKQQQEAERVGEAQPVRRASQPVQENGPQPVPAGNRAHAPQGREAAPPEVRADNAQAEAPAQPGPQRRATVPEVALGRETQAVIHNLHDTKTKDDPNARRRSVEVPKKDDELLH